MIPDQINTNKTGRSMFMVPIPLRLCDFISKLIVFYKRDDDTLGNVSGLLISMTSIRPLNPDCPVILYSYLLAFSKFTEGTVHCVQSKFNDNFKVRRSTRSILSRLILMVFIFQIYIKESFQSISICIIVYSIISQFP